MVPHRIKSTATKVATGREISRAGIGRLAVLFINASRRHSCTWFKTEVPAANKKTPPNMSIKAPFGELPVKKYPVMADMDTINESRILVSLTKTEIRWFNLFLLT